MSAVNEGMPPAKRLRKSGADYLDCIDHGTQEVAGLLEWPWQAVRRMPEHLAEEGIRSQLPSFFPRSASELHGGSVDRLLVTTCYTGLGTVERCVKRLARELNTCQTVVFWSGFECDPRCRDVIQAPKHCPQHLFGNIEDLFDSDLLRKMYTCVQVLKARADQLVKQAEGTAAKRQAVATISKRCMLKLFQLAKQGIEEGKVRSHAYCWIHHDFCRVHPQVQEGDVVLEAGGNSCIAFSPQGGRSQWVHESNVATVLWLALAGHRGKRNELHFIFQECSSLFTTEDAFEIALPKHFVTKVCKLSCRDVGIPMQRARKYSWSFNSRMFQLSADISEDVFVKMAGSPVICDGHDFFCADQQTVQKHLRCLSVWSLQTQSNQSEGAGQHQLCPEVVLSAGARVRLMRYNEVLLETHGAEPSKTLCGVVDLSQNPHARPHLKAELPSLMCHSCLWSQHRGRSLLPLESLVVMGWPIREILGECASEYP